MFEGRSARSRPASHIPSLAKGPLHSLSALLVSCRSFSRVVDPASQPSPAMFGFTLTETLGALLIFTAVTLLAVPKATMKSAVTWVGLFMESMHQCANTFNEVRLSSLRRPTFTQTLTVTLGWQAYLENEDDE